MEYAILGLQCQRKTGEKCALVRPHSGCNINTLTVSKTFRDGQPRIDENPILIAEPRPVGAIDRSSTEASNSSWLSR